MRNAYPRKLQVYRDPNGREPFSIWFRSIQDTRIQDRIQARLINVTSGNLGDYRSVGEGASDNNTDIPSVEQGTSSLVRVIREPEMEDNNE